MVASSCGSASLPMTPSINDVVLVDSISFMGDDSAEEEEEEEEEDELPLSSALSGSFSLLFAIFASFD